LQKVPAVKEALRHTRSNACLPRITIQQETRGGSLLALDPKRPPGPLEIRCFLADRPGPAVAKLLAASTT
jgi:hypothetical protein